MFTLRSHVGGSIANSMLAMGKSVRVGPGAGLDDKFWAPSLLQGRVMGRGDEQGLVEWGVAIVADFRATVRPVSASQGKTFLMSLSNHSRSIHKRSVVLRI